MRRDTFLRTLAALAAAHRAMAARRVAQPVGDFLGVRPVAVATGEAAPGRYRLRRIALQPLGDVVIEELPGPKHPGQRLTHDVRGVRVERTRDDAGIEFIRLLPARFQE